MIIKINRTNNGKSFIEELETQLENKKTVLEGLQFIKEKKDSTLTFRCGCESGVCGSCAVKVNGVERLACKTKLNEGDFIEPLSYTAVLRDLVVDLEHEQKVLNKSHSFLHQYQESEITNEDEKKIDRQSNCILCQSCYSSCPVLEVNKDFLGPYALTRALRYVNDKREGDEKSIINNIQLNGVWDCTLCGNCTLVCPQFIDPKSDIMNLRMKSVQAGYEDPTLQNFATIGNEFDTGFDPTGGFNPSGGFDPSGGFNPNSF